MAQSRPLSPREVQALSLRDRGATNKEGAQALRIAMTTFAHHIAHAQHKLGARNCAEANWLLRQRTRAD